MNERDKILSGTLKDRINKGIMIIGANTFDLELCTWYCSSEEEAVKLATHFCETTGGCYEIVNYEFLGVVRPSKLPTEFVKPSPQQ